MSGTVPGARLQPPPTPAPPAPSADQIFGKPLNATAVAVFAVNHAATATPITISFAAVPGLNYAPGASVALYNVWSQASIGSATTQWATTLASHDSAFLIINSA